MSPPLGVNLDRLQAESIVPHADVDVVLLGLLCLPSTEDEGLKMVGRKFKNLLRLAKGGVEHGMM